MRAVSLTNWTVYGRTWILDNGVKIITELRRHLGEFGSYISRSVFKMYLFLFVYCLLLYIIFNFKLFALLPSHHIFRGCLWCCGVMKWMNRHSDRGFSLQFDWQEISDEGSGCAFSLRSTSYTWCSCTFIIQIILIIITSLRTFLIHLRWRCQTS